MPQAAAPRHATPRHTSRLHCYALKNATWLLMLSSESCKCDPLTYNANQQHTEVWYAKLVPLRQMQILSLCGAANPCVDKSIDAVNEKAIELGIRKKGNLDLPYGCAEALRDGACSLLPKIVVREFCPKTCRLCEMPDPAPWCRIEDKFCLASQNWCDSSTKCGKPIKNTGDCSAAAAELGISSTVVELDSKDAPPGCFLAVETITHTQLYYNSNGQPSSNHQFVKALCSVRAQGTFAVGSRKHATYHGLACCRCVYALQSSNSLHPRTRQ